MDAKIKNEISELFSRNFTAQSAGKIAGNIPFSRNFACLAGNIRNAGWVRGTKEAEGKWGAFLWILQNQITFLSSTSAWWTTNNITVAITNVLVGSLGDYPPLTEVSDTGPNLDEAYNTYPGDNQGDEGIYQVDITNVFYDLEIPYIRITPRYALTCVGGGDVQFTAVGTNIEYGVAWSIIPSGVTSGATIQAGGYSASVTPGNVAQVYKIRAAVSNCPDFYDEAKLTVVRVKSVSCQTITSMTDNPGTNETLYVAYTETNQTFTLTAVADPGEFWPDDNPVWNGATPMADNPAQAELEVSGPGEYLVRASCGNSAKALKIFIIKVDSVDVHANDIDTHKIGSVLGADGKDHFICVKDTGDIILDATLSPNTSTTADAIKWEADGATITSPAVGSDKTTAKLSSSTAQQIPVRITAGGNPCWLGNVWVVWSTATEVSPIPINVIPIQDKTRIKGGYSFQYTIQPASIIPTTGTDDVPDLTGAYDPEYPPPDVPESDASVYNKGVNLRNGANAKWDISRQARQNIINPDNLPFPFETGTPASYFITYNNFPSDSVIGNDDQYAVNENNNPYADPDTGKLTGHDCPAATPLHSIGSVGNTFAIHFHAREFTRLQLKDKWYRISDDLLWKIHWKFKKASEAEINQDYNEDGDKLDEVWIDNGSFIATDNNDF